MIAVLLSCLLFVFGLVCTFSAIPPTKLKPLQLWLSPFHNNSDHKNRPQDNATKTPISKNCGGRRSSRIDLRDVFATFDKNNDGFITRQELKESLTNMGISAGEKDVVDMVEKVDANGDGLIDLGEFCELCNSISGPCGGGGEGARDGDLREAFDVFDGNKDGLITVEELGLVLSSLGFTEGKKLEDCEEMIRKVDMDGDGMVNYDEFKRMMKAGFGRLIPVS